MVHTRLKYHSAVKAAKRAAANLRAESLLEASEAGNRALMKELKKTLSNKQWGQQVPDSIDGRVGHEPVLEKFKECYKALYNSAGSKEAVDEIKDKLKGAINYNSSAKEVHKSLERLLKCHV